MKPAAIKTRPRQSIIRAGELQPEFSSQAVSLTNGRYTVSLSGIGSGFSQYGGAAVTRHTPDPTCETDGFHIYLRDLDDPFTWSAGYLPTRVSPAQYSFRCEAGVAEFVRVDRDVECRLEVCVSPQLDLEIRRCLLTNVCPETRRIEVTSYLEWVLGSRAADASHPAFAKLFVETSYCKDRSVIIARRRPRHPDEPNLVGFHSIVCDTASKSFSDVEFETNRARFIGRGRTTCGPKALSNGSHLSGDSGPVLDPIASLRVVLSIDPGQSREVAFVLGASTERDGIDRALANVQNFEQVRSIFDDARSRSATLNGDSDFKFRANGGNGEPTRLIVHSSHDMPKYDATDANSSPRFKPAGAATTNSKPIQTNQSEPLKFENGFGGFSADGREYVIRINPDGTGGQHRPPMPWVNVIANEKAGCLVTESGAGCTWAGNSRLNRLTAWHNDPITDPHSEACWIRDEDAGIFWSPTPGPTPATSDYETRHGFGYTTFNHESQGLLQTTTMFVAREQPVKITRLRVENRSGSARRLSVFFYLHWALGGLLSETSGNVTTAYDPKTRVIWATNPQRDYYDQYNAFSALRCGKATTESVTFSCDRSAFLGRYADMQAPSAIAGGGELDRLDGDGLDPCAAWQVTIDLAPGEACECLHLLGESLDRDAARELLAKFENEWQVEQELDRVKSFWQDAVSAITVETPDDEVNLMVGGWLLYQNLSCRMWGRSAYFQPGGAFGFRDQLQDSAAFVHHRPDITRTQIVRHAGQQFVEGDVLHWWHPDTGYGVRTRFSDDLLWLPYIAAEYVQKTGDVAVLDEDVPFIVAPALVDGHQEAYLRPSPSGVSASIYEHCCRALDRGLTRGRNGLPLIGCGDWNDGFSRVGRLGEGESVWLGFFIDHILERFLPICSARGDDARVLEYSAYRDQLRSALNTAGWDGAWYRRAYYDNGHPIGSASSDECQIDAIAQAWAVISGVASPERAQMAIAAAEERLVDEEAGIIRLLTPAFDRTPNDPGYIKGYLRGIRENGGQYTHGVLWVVRALAEMGRGTRAAELLRMLTPVAHTSTLEDVGVYQTEPYVVAADVYGEPPHVGRGGWTWYTGSAGWMYRVAIESILGLTTEGGTTLLLNPSISTKWPECRVNYRLPDSKTLYEITIANPFGREHVVHEAVFDNNPAEIVDGVARIPLVRDGAIHRVVVRL
jgi:cyclic beta-1,2-glucan synthetase